MKHIIGLIRPPKLDRSTFVDRLLDNAPAVAGGMERLALDLPVNDYLYERFGRRPTRNPPWDAVAHVWTTVDAAPMTIAARFAELAVSAVAWEVTEHVVWPYEPDWPNGIATPGVKQISFVAKLASVTPADFEARYCHHREVAAVEHVGTWQYTQNLVTAIGTDDPTLQFAAVSEMWFRSADDLVDRYYTTPASRAIAYADTRHFIDPVLTTWLLVTEHRFTAKFDIGRTDEA
jgi:hypothetical protein